MSNPPSPSADRRASQPTSFSRMLAVVLMTLALLGAVAAPASARPKSDKAKGRDRTAEPVVESTTTESPVDLDGTISSSEPVLELSALEPLAPSVHQDSLDVEPAQSAAPGSLTTVARQIGATELWADGFTGAGVHVAVIDTGVAPVPALTGDDKVVAIVDLSFEAAEPKLSLVDHYGHGTHMAGIIAGNDPGIGFRGIAPDAGIVAVKIADHDGRVNIEQVVAAIDWVTANKDAAGLDIRVLNLSWGTDETKDGQLQDAVERAWDAGIVVVVAAGNDGRSGWGLANPASNPFVIAVGAGEVSGDKSQAASFSTSSYDRPPDLIAPGVSIESLRAPGSTIDLANPDARVGDDLFKGSGSSQSAAVVSGAIALLLDARPDLTPDQVKYLVRATATASGQEWFAGQGLLDIAAAAQAPTPGSEATQRRPLSSDTATTGDGSWTGASWTNATWTNATWTGASWTGASWTGATWG